MESDGPYKHYGLCDRAPFNGLKCPACAYAEGRKAAENYTEQMLVCAKDEVRKCHEEIRRLEDKYARNVYKIPSDGGSYWTPITNVELEKLTNFFDELLEMANNLYATCSSTRSCDAFYAWKKERGIE